MPAFRPPPGRAGFAMLLLLLGSAATSAQERHQHPLSRDEFIAITGAGCAVRYTTGGLDRADHLLRRVQLLTGYFSKWYELPTPTVVYVMRRTEWERASLPDVYGLPLRTGPSGIAAPLEGDAGTVALWREKFGLDMLPLSPGVPLIGTPEEAATLSIADVLLQVEAARGFTQRAQLLGRQAWVGELAAHAAAQLVFKKHEAKRLPEITRAYQRLADRLGGDRAYPIAEYRHLQIVGAEGLDRWLWFQAQFHAGALIVTEKTGQKTMKRLIELSEKAGLLTAEDLLRAYPELGPWLDQRFGPAPGH